MLEYIVDAMIVLVSVIIITGIVRKLAEVIGGQLNFYGMMRQAWYKVKKMKTRL